MPGTTTILYGICVLLVSCAVSLVFIARHTTRSSGTVRVNIDTFELTEALDRINRAIEHHAEISAVLGLMKQLEAEPDAIELIKSYPQTVRAAAMLHYVNSLGSALQHAQARLADFYKTYGSTSFATKTAQQSVDDIRQKLNAAVAASKQLDSTS